MMGDLDVAGGFNQFIVDVVLRKSPPLVIKDQVHLIVYQGMVKSFIGITYQFRPQFELIESLKLNKI